MTKKLFMVMNEDFFFLSHRKQIGIEAQRKGYEVTVVAKDTGYRAVIERMGLKFIGLPINPTGMNPFQEFRTFLFLKKLYKNNPGIIVHHVGLKVMLWGMLAARNSGIAGVVNAVCGLGILFSNEKSLLAKSIMKILKYGNNRNVVFIFQNHDDEKLFNDNKITRQGRTYYIKGSGIDLEEFSFKPMPREDNGKIKILFTGRMVEDKGVLILIQAAELLRNKYFGSVEFLLAGGLRTNPRGINKEYLESVSDGVYIKWLGFRRDVRELLESSSIVAFPSYYREGLPKSLIEANAVGRPIVTTDSIGCRDTVEDGVNGFLVPVKDSIQLAEKISILLDDYPLRCRMSKAARAIAERDFSLKEVVRRHIEIYDGFRR